MTIKVDYTARFRDVSQLILERTTGSQEPAPGFKNVLGSLLEKPAQVTETVQLKQSVADPPKIKIDELRARYQLPEPSMRTVENALSFEGTELLASVNQAQQSVKTPTLLEVRRIRQDLPSKSARSSEVDAIKADAVQAMIEDAGARFGIDPALSMAVVSRESGFNPRAVSSDGHASKGLFQLLDTTGRDLLDRSDIKARYEPFKPDLNVELGVSYLRYLHDIFSRNTDLPGNLQTSAAANSTSLEKLAVAAFNAGEGRVASAQERVRRAGGDAALYQSVEPYLPESTRDYVNSVITERDTLKSRFID